MYVISRFAVALVSLCFSGDRVPGLTARNHGSVDTSARHSLDQSFLESLGRLSHQHRADRTLVYFPGAPSVVDVRRDCARALPATDLAPETARMGVSSRSRKVRAKRPRFVCAFHVVCSVADVGALGFTLAINRRSAGDGTAAVIWLISPLIAYLVSKPRTDERKTVER